MLPGENEGTIQRLALPRDDERAVTLVKKRKQAVCETADDVHLGRAAGFEPVHVVIDVAHLKVHELTGDGVAVLEMLEEELEDAALAVFGGTASHREPFEKLLEFWLVRAVAALFVDDTEPVGIAESPIHDLGDA